MTRKHLSLFFSLTLLVATARGQDALDPNIIKEIQGDAIPSLEQPIADPSYFDIKAPDSTAIITYDANINDNTSQKTNDLPKNPTSKASVVESPNTSSALGQINNPIAAPKNFKKSLISFNYNGQDLITVINDIAARKKINFILPQGEDAKTLAAAKLTLSFENEISLDKAWQLLQTALDLAGFSIMPKGNMYLIVKNSDTTATEPAPLYIDVPASELPDSQQRIRYIAYLANIKVSDENEGELQAVIKTLLPEIPKNAFVIDKRTNSILIMAKASEIKALMEVVSQLDKAGFQEKIDVVKLRHTDARTVATLFQNNILKAPDQGINRYHLDARKQTEATYFSQFARVVPEPRTNALIIIGRAQAVDRIKDFILEYVDIELGSGKSILHVYQLQYLNALEFKDILKRIVESKIEGGTDQSKAAGAIVGAERYFDEVIIETDTPAQTAEQAAAQAASTQDVSLIPPSTPSGSNSLIIAARNDDWLVIKKIIEQLDTPLPQVLMEIFIADLTDEDMRKLGATVRNPLKLPLFNGMNFQAGMLEPGIVTDAGVCNPSVSPTADAIPSTVGVIADNCTDIAAADILGPNKPIGSTEQVTCNGAPIDNPAGMAQEGSTIISFNDNNGKTWGVAQILTIIDNTRIISHPHIISVSNKESLVKIGEKKLLAGGLAGAGGSTLAQKQEYVEAALTVKIIPRINLDEDTVNLALMVASNDFTQRSASDGNQNIRQVQTNANVRSKEMLAIGGLMRNRNEYESNKTPLFGDVPILGQFFKSRRQAQTDNNFTLFIVPTIIKPRLRGGIGEQTRKYVSIARSYASHGDLFDNLRDPISHWFFKSGIPRAEHIVSDFLDHDEIHTNVPFPDDRRKEFAQNTVNTPEQLKPDIVDDIKQEKSPFKKAKTRAKAHLRS